MSVPSASPVSIQGFTDGQVLAIKGLARLIEAVSTNWTSPEHFKSVVAAAERTGDSDLISIVAEGKLAENGLVVFAEIKGKIEARIKAIGL